MPVSSSAAKVPRLGQIDCWIGLAGVAQSVAQLSCKHRLLITASPRQARRVVSTRGIGA